MTEPAAFGSCRGTDGLESCHQPGVGVDWFSAEEGNVVASLFLTHLAFAGPQVTSLILAVGGVNDEERQM